MVRKYAKVNPRLWTESREKALRGDPLLQSLAMYLLTIEFEDSVRRLTDRG